MYPSTPSRYSSRIKQRSCSRIGKDEFRDHITEYCTPYGYERRNRSRAKSMRPDVRQYLDRSSSPSCSRRSSARMSPPYTTGRMRNGYHSRSKMRRYTSTSDDRKYQSHKSDGYRSSLDRDSDSGPECVDNSLEVRKVYVCPDCHHVIGNLLEFDAHTYMHKHQKPYSCSACPYRTKRRCDALKHINTRKERLRDAEHQDATLQSLDIKLGPQNYPEYEQYTQTVNFTRYPECSVKKSRKYDVKEVLKQTSLVHSSNRSCGPHYYRKPEESESRRSEGSNFNSIQTPIKMSESVASSVTVVKSSERKDGVSRTPVSKIESQQMSSEKQAENDKIVALLKKQKGNNQQTTVQANEVDSSDGELKEGIQLMDQLFEKYKRTSNITKAASINKETKHVEQDDYFDYEALLKSVQPSGSDSPECSDTEKRKSSSSSSSSSPSLNLSSSSSSSSPEHTPVKRKPLRSISRKSLFDADEDLSYIRN